MTCETMQELFKAPIDPVKAFGQQRRLAIVAALAALCASTPLLAADGQAAQANAPVQALDLYLIGFHPMKKKPAHQMEAHHFCHQIREEFLQCALFDGNGKDARLNGIEYILSEKLFDALPAGEKKYWHPHNYEILSGQLVAPGLPAAAEHALMGGKMNSYGKTWHVWMTGSGEGEGDRMPLGEPMLAWSFNHDGEARPGLVELRDRTMGIDSGQLAKERKDLAPSAHPQSGADALKGKLPARPR